SDRRRAALRPLRRPAVAPPGARRGRHRLFPPGPSGLAPSHAPHRRAACHAARSPTGRVLVPVRRRGPRADGDGTSPRWSGRRVLAAARRTADRHAGPAGRAGNASGFAANSRAPRWLTRARAECRAGWRTLELSPGSLFHLPPWTPHDVVCHGRSLALSLTWTTAAARGARARTARLGAW